MALLVPIQPVVMPVLNNADQTADAIMDVLAQVGPALSNLKLLLIDQGSDAVTRAMLADAVAQAPARVRLWTHDPPLGALAATWNHALAWAWAAGAESCWVVNNDVRLHPDTYQSLVEVQQLTAGWFIGCCNVQPQVWELDRQRPIQVNEPLCALRGGPDFSCFLITRRCHERYPFDEGFQPAYYEDNDYHRRLTLGGDGEQIFGVAIPYRHFGSGTLKDPRNAPLRDGWAQKFQRSADHYRAKWGGLPGAETFTVPFGGRGVRRRTR